MKKLFGLIAVFILAITAVAVVSIGNDAALAASCTNGSKYSDFEGSRNGTLDTLTVSTKGNKKLCKDVKVNFTTFEVLNKNYNGKPFSKNPTAIPQASYWNKTVTLKKGTTGKVTVKMAIPDACTPYQIDAYVGPVQTKITGFEGLKGTSAIVGKLVNKTKTNCTVKVCNPATGQIITVHEKDASKYKPVGDIACKPPVKVCNPATGEIITVKASDASKYKPVGDVACKPLQVCDFETKTVKTIKPFQFDSNKMSKDLNAEECQPAPEKVNVCNPATGKIIVVDEDEADNYKPVGDVACTEAEVCNPETGEIITVRGDKVNEYKDVDDAACAETPETPETPKELPHTGPVEAFASLIGAGALTGTATTYFRSRRARQ